MTQLLLHLVGDYILQSHWIALKKAKSSLVCAVHCVLYTLPFLVLTRSWLVLLLIGGTHFLIDRWGLARYVSWAKNWIAPVPYARWEWCRTTGFYDRDERDRQQLHLRGDLDSLEKLKRISEDPAMDRPVWLRVWLLIITDNSLHLICNALALRYAG